MQHRRCQRQGSHASLKVLDFFFKILGPGKSRKITLVLESPPGKIVAARCHILRLKCTKFDFGWGSASDPTLAPDPLAGFKGFYF